MTKAQEGSSSSQSSGSPQLERVPSVRQSSSKHVISESAISLNKVLGNGEFGTVQQGVWVDDDGERVGTLTRSKYPWVSSDYMGCKGTSYWGWVLGSLLMGWVGAPTGCRYTYMVGCYI